MGQWSCMEYKSTGTGRRCAKTPGLLFSCVATNTTAGLPGGHRDSACHMQAGMRLRRQRAVHEDGGVALAPFLLDRHRLSSGQTGDASARCMGNVVGQTQRTPRPASQESPIRGCPTSPQWDRPAHARRAYPREESWRRCSWCCLARTWDHHCCSVSCWVWALGRTCADTGRSNRSRPCQR